MIDLFVIVSALMVYPKCITNVLRRQVAVALQTQARTVKRRAAVLAGGIRVRK
jgi:hypothetical protein